MSPHPSVDLSSVVAASSDLISSDLDGEIVMMSVDKGEYYGLDAIGSRIWALLKEPRKVSELCAILTEEFDVEREQCERDVLTFLNEMATDSLVSVATP